MMPLYDMMQQAANGHATAEMARRFGLSEAQVAQAMAALAPAFSAGLKRNTAGSAPMAAFLSALSDGHHRRYFEDVQAAFTPQGVQEGNGILGHIFGSKDLSRKVAEQAASATGIGQDIFKQMLPVLASMVMGGLYTQANNQAARAQNPMVTGPDFFGDMLKQMIRYQAAGREDLPEPKPQAASPFDNPVFGNFNDMMETMFGQNRTSDTEPPPEADEPAPEQKRGDQKATLDGMFGQMFDAGREVQTGYAKSMDQIFDQYLDGMKRQS